MAQLEPFFIKVKQYAQSKSDASGWNKHVNKGQKRIGNRVTRRVLRQDTDGFERKYR